MLATTTRKKEPKIKNAGTVGWLQQSIHRGRNEVFSEVKTITPALAEVMLQSNQSNRRLRPRKLDQMVRDIKGGRWAFNGEPIIVARTGELNDGQHRLQAIIEAGSPLQLLVVFGVERETRTTLDQGANRSPGDYLHMDGVANSMTLAAITRYVLAYEQSDKTNLGRYTHITAAEILPRAESDRTLHTSTKFAKEYEYRMRKFARSTVVGFCHNILLREDVNDGVSFMEMLCTGENLQRGDAAFTARERLVGLETRSVTSQIEIIFRAWNAYRERRPITKIPVHGRLPELV